MDDSDNTNNPAPIPPTPPLPDDMPAPTAVPSPDDALAPADDIFNPTLDEEKLAGDFDTPAAPAADNGNVIAPDDPATDTDIDSSEVYGEGLDVAAGTPASAVPPAAPAADDGADSSDDDIPATPQP